jgi:hypothetical protein
MMDQNNDKKCIYCTRSGPFSDEHVFPAGMGGDDKDFLLEDLVCADCNTTIFSPLELSLMRRSPTGLGRKFLQSKTREKGKRTTKPTIETKGHFIIDESGDYLEAEYDKEGNDIVLAQCIFKGDSINYAAHDRDNLKKLYSELSKHLNSSTVDLIIKKRELTVSYEVTTYEWGKDEYVLSSTVELPKAPKLGIWLEAMSSAQASISPRFYQRSKGQLVLKIGPQSKPAELLRSMRRTLPSMLAKQGEAAENSINQPVIHIEMPIDMHSTERAIAKIGVNFLAHTFGPEFVRRSEFDRVKQSIRTGRPELLFSAFGPEDEDTTVELFGSPPAQCHCLMLIGVPSDNGFCEVYFNAKLYGSRAYQVTLAQSLPLTDLFHPFYFLVYYEENRIEKLSMLEYQLRYGVLVQRFLESENNQ